jgi:hypothetical protein
MTGPGPKNFDGPAKIKERRRAESSESALSYGSMDILRILASEILSVLLPLEETITIWPF